MKKVNLTDMRDVRMLLEEIARFAPTIAGVLNDNGMRHASYMVECWSREASDCLSRAHELPCIVRDE